MPIEFAEDLLENDDFKVQTDGNGDLIQEHKQTGATFKFDSTKNAWIPVEGLDLEGANISNVSDLDVGTVSTGQINNDGSPVSLDDVLDLINITAGSTETVFKGELNGDDRFSKDIQFTEDVSTSAKTILNRGNINPVVVEVTAVGELNGGAARFLDKVYFEFTDGVVLGTDKNDDGKASTRTYGSANNGNELTLSMGADTYQILAISESTRVT